MGYRNYIGQIPKREYNKIKKMSRLEIFQYKNPGKEIDEDDMYVGAYKLVGELYNFGKYVEFGDDKFFKPFFKNKQTQEYYNSDGEFVIVEKEFLGHIIEWFKNHVASMYSEMLDPIFKDDTSFINSVETKYGFEKHKYKFDCSLITEEQQTALFRIIEHVRSNGTEWLQLTPYNLEKGSEITTSWKYEYSIFELVNIYKSFDWKKNIMVWYGW